MLLHGFLSWARPGLRVVAVLLSGLALALVFYLWHDPALVMNLGNALLSCA